MALVESAPHPYSKEKTMKMNRRHGNISIVVMPVVLLLGIVCIMIGIMINASQLRQLSKQQALDRTAAERAEADTLNRIEQVYQFRERQWLQFRDANPQLTVPPLPEKRDKRNSEKHEQ
jgi:hypothetical protein